MIPDRYPSKYHPEGHRPKSRRELRDEVADDLRAYDAPFSGHSIRAGGQGRARSSYRQEDSTSRQDDRRHRSRTRTGRSQYASTHSGNRSRSDDRGRSRAGTRNSGSGQRSRSRTVTGRGRSRTATKLFNYLTPERIPASSRTSIRVTDREQTDRRTANPPSTSYTVSKGSRMDYFRRTQAATSMAPSRASTRASTLHPDDSASNGTYESRDRRRCESKPEIESRGRSRAPTNSSRTQYDTYRDYPPTLSPKPSGRSSQRQSQRGRSPSITHAFARDSLDPRMSYTYNPQQAPPPAATAASRASASRASRASSPPRTAAHPHGWEPLDGDATHIWRGDERALGSGAPTHRSEAPTHHSEAPTHRSEAPTHRSSTSRRSEAAPTHRSEALTHRSPTSRRSEAPTHHSGAPTHHSGAPIHRSEAPTHRSPTTRRSQATPPTTRHSSTSRRSSEQASSIYRPSRQSEAPTRHPSRYGPILIPCRLIPRDSPPPPSSYRTEILTPQTPAYGDGGLGGPSVGRSVRFSGQIYERSASSWTGTEDEVEFSEARVAGFSLRR